MGKKIMVLNGSPRAKGNTAGLVQAFQEGAEAAGHQVTVFNLQSMEIHPCRGCGGGGKDPASPCVQKDDMARIYPVYREADVVVLASPLYYWTVSGQLKCALDRLYAVEEGPGERLKKECVLLMAAAGEDFDASAFWYREMVKHIGWIDRGQLLAGGLWKAGDVAARAEILEKARRLGENL